MLDAVPLGIDVGLLEPEVGGNVHDLDALFQQGDAGFGAGLVGQRREDDIQLVAQVGGDVQFHVVQMGEHFAQGLAGGAASGDRGDFDFGMVAQDADEFAAGVSGDVDDANFEVAGFHG